MKEHQHSHGKSNLPFDPNAQTNASKKSFGNAIKEALRMLGVKKSVPWHLRPKRNRQPWMNEPVNLAPDPRIQVRNVTCINPKCRAYHGKIQIQRGEKIVPKNIYDVPEGRKFRSNSKIACRVCKTPGIKIGEFVMAPANVVMEARNV